METGPLAHVHNAHLPQVCYPTFSSCLYARDNFTINHSNLHVFEMWEKQEHLEQTLMVKGTMQNSTDSTRDQDRMQVSKSVRQQLYQLHTAPNCLQELNGSKMGFVDKCRKQTRTLLINVTQNILPAKFSSQITWIINLVIS